MADLKTKVNRETEELPFFVEYTRKAREEHVQMEQAFIPGYISFTSDVDVKVDIYRKTFDKNCILMFDGRVDINDAYLYLVNLDGLQDTLNKFHDDVESGKIETETFVNEETGEIRKSSVAPINLNIELERVDMGDGKGITAIEYLVWLAITTTEDEETKRRIFESAYQVEEKDGLEQATRRASKRYDPITKLHQNMSNPALYEEAGVLLDVAGRGEKKKGKEVNTLVSLEVIDDDGESVALSRRLSDFDIEVYNAIASLYEDGKRAITLREIAELTIGESSITSQQIDSVAESVEILRRTLLTADVTQEAKAHKLTDPETGEPWAEMRINDFLFNAVRIDMKSTNGKVTTGYKTHSMPVGLKYAKASKQIVSYDAKYLATRSAGSNTERNIVVKNYLLRRIAQAKGGKMSNTIRYEKIYDKAGINKENRVERSRINKYVSKLMELWQSQGLFKSFKIVGEGRRSIAKIVISFDK